MSNILNVYIPEARELVLANLFFYPASYDDAVRIACEQGAEFVHGIDSDDIKKHETKTTNPVSV